MGPALLISGMRPGFVIKARRLTNVPAGRQPDSGIDTLLPPAWRAAAPIEAEDEAPSPSKESA